MISVVFFLIFTFFVSHNAFCSVDEKRNVILKSFCHNREEIEQVLKQSSQAVQYSWSFFNTIIGESYQKQIEKKKIIEMVNPLPSNVLSFRAVIKEIAGTICYPQDINSIFAILDNIKNVEFKVIKKILTPKYYISKKYIDTYNIFKTYENPDSKTLGVDLLKLDTDLECLIVLLDPIINKDIVYYQYGFNSHLDKKIADFDKQLSQLSSNDFNEYIQFLENGLSVSPDEEFEKLYEIIYDKNTKEQYDDICDQILAITNPKRGIDYTSSKTSYEDYFKLLLNVFDACRNKDKRNNSNWYLQYNYIVYNYNFGPIKLIKELMLLLYYKKEFEFLKNSIHRAKLQAIYVKVENLLEQFQTWLRNLEVKFDSDPAKDFLQRQSLEKLNLLHTLFPTTIKKLSVVAEEAFAEDVELVFQPEEQILNPPRINKALFFNVLRSGVAGFSSVFGIYMLYKYKFTEKHKIVVSTLAYMALVGGLYLPKSNRLLSFFSDPWVNIPLFAPLLVFPFLEKVKKIEKGN